MNIPADLDKPISISIFRRQYIINLDSVFCNVILRRKSLSAKMHVNKILKQSSPISHHTKRHGFLKP